MARGRRRFSPLQLLLSVFLFAVTLTMIVPLLHILARSLSDPGQSGGMNGLEIFPRGLTLVNYRTLFGNRHVVPAMLNSVFITAVGTALNILLTLTAAYVLTRPDLAGKGVLMVFLIVMMLFDPGIVPEYMVIRKLGLMGSRWSVILAQAANVYYLIIMMRYLEAVPVSLYEAARIDGAGHMRTLFSVAAPLAKASIATLTLFYAVLRWNEYYRAGIYISSVAKVPLQVILRRFVVEGDVTTLVGTQNLMEYNEAAQLDYKAVSYAAILVAVAPILCAYPFVLRFCTKNVLAGAVKE